MYVLEEKLNLHGMTTSTWFFFWKEVENIGIFGHAKNHGYTTHSRIARKVYFSFFLCFSSNFEM